MNSELRRNAEWAPSYNSSASVLAPPPWAPLLEVVSPVASTVGAYSPKFRSRESVRGVVVASLLRSQSRPCVAYERPVPASLLDGCVSSVASRCVASPKFVVSPALQSIKCSARARKVLRLARRIAGIAEGHRRQQM